MSGLVDKVKRTIDDRDEKWKNYRYKFVLQGLYMHECHEYQLSYNLMLGKDWIVFKWPFFEMGLVRKYEQNKTSW